MQTRTKALIASIGGAVILGLTSAALAGEGHKGGGPMGRIADFVSLADANGDGKVTREEVAAFRSAEFKQFDANKDGKLNAEEYVAMAEDIRLKLLVVRFKKHDLDSDGNLTEAELATRADRMFDHLDQSNTGAIVLEDLRERRGFRHRMHGDEGHHGMKGRHHCEKNDDHDGKKSDGMKKDN